VCASSTLGSSYKAFAALAASEAVPPLAHPHDADCPSRATAQLQSHAGGEPKLYWFKSKSYIVVVPAKAGTQGK